MLNGWLNTVIRQTANIDSKDLVTLFQRCRSNTIRQGGVWCRLASVMEDTHLRFLLICQNRTRAAAVLRLVTGDCDSPVWESEVLMIWLFRSGYQLGRGESLSMSTIPSVPINQTQADTTLYLNTPVNPFIIITMPRPKCGLTGGLEYQIYWADIKYF